MPSQLCLSLNYTMSVLNYLSKRHLPISSSPLSLCLCAISVIFLCVVVFRFSALHHAALTGTTDLLSVLLEAQATVDIKDRNGETQHYLSPALRSASKTANTGLSEIISVSTDIISDVFYQWHTLS